MNQEPTIEALEREADEALPPKADEVSSPRRRRGGLRIWFVVAGAAILVGVTAGAMALRPTSEASRDEVKRDAPLATLPRVQLSAATLEKNPIRTERVTRTRLAADLQVVGSVAYDQNQYAVVGPLVSGRVVRLRAALGDHVRAGQVLAEIESSDVGEAQAKYLSARARARAAQTNLRREEELAAQHISSTREREVAEAQAIIERAELTAAVERLRALGLSPPDLARLERDESEGTGGRVALRAPLGGTVITRSVTLGQAVERATDAFKIANLTQLWVLLELYEKDLAHVHVGQRVELRTEALGKELLPGTVAYVEPTIDEKTRTTNVRVEFANTTGKLRPGQFVTARLIGDPRHAGEPALAVSRRAVQSVDGKRVVFVRSRDGFERRTVMAGMTAGDLIEIRDGLKEGDDIATDGAFLLKSELLR